jgi:hypothetical protein
MALHRVVALFIALIFSSAMLSAQDRVLLFDQPLDIHDGMTITEVTVDRRGRDWNVRRVVELPRHFIGRAPVVLADGHHLAWLALENEQARSLVLVTYDPASGNATIPVRRRFGIGATLIADPARLRVVVVEEQQIVIIDAGSPERIVSIQGTSRLDAIGLGGSRLVVGRYDANHGNNDVVIVNVDTGAIEGVLAGAPGAAGGVVTSDGDRLYRFHQLGLEQRIDLISLPAGEVIASHTGLHGAYPLTLDERRGVLAYARGSSIGALDARTLMPVGELGAGVFRERKSFALNETASKDAILVRSSALAPSYMGDCVDRRVDVFDGTALTLVNRIDLGGRCTLIVPLPNSRAR